MKESYEIMINCYLEEEWQIRNELLGALEALADWVSLNIKSDYIPPELVFARIMLHSIPPVEPDC